MTAAAGGPALSTAFWDYDRTTPLVDGRVGVEGFTLAPSILTPEQAFARAFADAPFDVTEISLSNTITAVSRDAAAFPYTLIPAFLSRTFRHAALFVRTDRGIATPADLAGKTIGLQEYDMTAAVVLRGTLRDEFGLDTRSCRWLVGEAARTKPLAFPVDPPPADLRMEILPPGTALEDRLLAGELDALMSLRTPRAIAAGDARIAPMFPDARAAEQASFARTGVFPIMHAVGIRKSLVAAHPELPRRLYVAFLAAKQMAVAALEVRQAPKVTLPWIADALVDMRKLVGDDVWPYGIAPNAHTLRTQLRWSREDGLQARPVAIEDLFHASVLDT